MLRRTLFLVVAGLLMTLATSSKAHAWGAFHAGYTHYGPVTGFNHVGYTAVGGYRGGAYGAGAYHYGYGYGGAYGGAAGYYRRW